MPSFPGGGQILFRPQDGPGYEYEGVGIVSSDGTIRTYSSPEQSFALWDPARPRATFSSFPTRVSGDWWDLSRRRPSLRHVLGVMVARRALVTLGRLDTGSVAVPRG
jgi:hypothetical protein